MHREEQKEWERFQNNKEINKKKLKETKKQRMQTRTGKKRKKKAKITGLKRMCKKKAILRIKKQRKRF